jgi:zinc transport system permease protein
MTESPLLEALECFSYPFVWRALAVAVSISLCSALLGVTLVLRRFSLIGDGLSHVAFGALAVAAVAGLSSPFPAVLAITVAAAIALLAAGDRLKIKGDAATAMISTTALAAGYLLLNIFKASSNVSGDVCTTLFGSTTILTLGSGDVWLAIGLSLCVVLWFIFCGRTIFAISFDEDFARTRGLNVNAFNLLSAAAVGVVIVLAMKLAGALLVSALIVFPAVSAMRIARGFSGVLVCASLISAVCAASGVCISVIASTPAGPSTVCVEAAVCFTILALSKRK